MIGADFFYQWWWLTFKLKHLRVHSHSTFIIDTVIQMSLHVYVTYILRDTFIDRYNHVHVIDSSKSKHF